MKLYSIAFVLALAALPAAAGAQPAAPAPAPSATPAAPAASFEALLSKSSQALLFDLERGEYVVVRTGERFGAFEITSISKDQIVFSTGESPRHHFVIVRRGAIPEPTAPPPEQPAAERPVAVPVEPADEPIDPYSQPKPEPEPVAEPTPPAAPAPKPPQKKVVEETITFPRSEFDGALEDFTVLASEIQVERMGAHVEITEISRGSFFHRLGLRKGDRVVSVAGRRIDDVDAAAEVYALLKRADRFTIKLYRGTQRTKIHVVLKR